MLTRPVETQTDFQSVHKGYGARGGFQASTANGRISDTVELPNITRFIISDTDAVLSVVYDDNSEDDSLPVLAGVQYAIDLRQIKSTGTTANIVIHCQF